MPGTARLDQVLQRQSEVSGLTRKYGSTITEVLAWAAQSAVRLDELEGSDERIEQLRTQVVDLTARLDASSAQITAARKAGAQHLSDAVHAELAALAMRHARIQFALVPTDEVGPHGAEAVQLLFAANAGSPPAPLVPREPPEKAKKSSLPWGPTPRAMAKETVRRTISPCPLWKRP